jgi:hypothetical protein
MRYGSQPAATIEAAMGTGILVPSLDDVMFQDILTIRRRLACRNNEVHERAKCLRA